MKTDAKTDFVPRALREVWEMKRLVYEETKHLSTREALEYILNEGGKIARRLNLPVASSPLRAPAAKVAETPAKYRAKRKR
jgi:hypothetical protein